MLTALLTVAALAHPFDNSFYGHDLTLTVAPDALTLDYTAEIPTRDLMSELRAAERTGRGATFEADKVGELVGGLSLTVDGVRPALVESSRPASVVESRFTRIAVRLQAPLSVAPHRIELGNANAPEQVAYFRTAVAVARPWTVTAISRDPHGRVRLEDWRMEEGARRTVLDLEPASALRRAVLLWHPDPRGYRSAGVALDTRLAREAQETWLPVAALAVGALLALIVGVVRSRRAPTTPPR